MEQPKWWANTKIIHKLHTQIFVFSESEEVFSLFYMQFAF